MKNETDVMSFEVARVLAFLAGAMSVTLIASNLAALKLWRLAVPYYAGELRWLGAADFVSQIRWLEIPVDAGIFLFPISYIAGDLLVEIYGQKMANLVATYAAGSAVVIAGLLWFARTCLPDFPSADNSAFLIVQSATGRIFLASVAGFFASQLINNAVFVWMRHKCPNDDAKMKNFHRRSMISSLVARTADSLIFETLAFYGRVSTQDFISQVAFAYLAGMFLEWLFSPLNRQVMKHLYFKLHYVDGKKNYDFS